MYFVYIFNVVLPSDNTNKLNNHDMNLATGNSAKKEHWSRGAKTACNRKMSVGKNDTDFFKLIAAQSPQMCCSKCLAKFNRN